MNGPEEKTFKQFWREFTKEGWKPRQPTGHVKHHRYMKPGIKGCLDESRHGEDFFAGEEEMMAYGRRSGHLQLDVLGVARENQAPAYATEQEDVAMAPILEDKEYPRYANDDEAKSESDVHEVASVAVELDVFDSDNFMEGLRKEKLFVPTDADDVNIMQTSDTSDSGSDAGDGRCYAGQRVLASSCTGR
ncbi:hypothetical protein PC110_g4406 [Phytophthora cactorum]|uniref:Uncharacterized protein n=2 Tax=Phytophthora cactorum TaxID=29920 RepID=A0A329SS44_9STRA|nr:hypothetical protein PC110_g4406 [Phytophthora cactorum]